MLLALVVAAAAAARRAAHVHDGLRRLLLLGLLDLGPELRLALVGWAQPLPCWLLLAAAAATAALAAGCCPSCWLLLLLTAAALAAAAGCFCLSSRRRARLAPCRASWGLLLLDRGRRQEQVPLLLSLVVGAAMPLPCSLSPFRPDRHHLPSPLCSHSPSRPSPRRPPRPTPPHSHSTRVTHPNQPPNHTTTHPQHRSASHVGCSCRRRPQQQHRRRGQGGVGAHHQRALGQVPRAVRARPAGGFGLIECMGCGVEEAGRLSVPPSLDRHPIHLSIRKAICPSFP